jgi:hypothetical protein
VRLRASSISASVRSPIAERLPRKPPEKCPSSSAKATTSTGRPAMAPQHVADPVDGSLQTAGLEPGHQPAAGFHVRGREGRPVDAGAEPADRAQVVEVGQKGLGVDLGHDEPSC